MTNSDQVRSLLLGLTIGDALGVPVEFCLRSQRDKDPVTGMRAFGTHKQPAGTWSDDTSLTLCLVEALSEGLDYHKLSQKFIRWRDECYLTATGEVFDVGMGTDRSIGRMREGIEPTLCGGADEKSNGNGSLMRIAPLAFLPETGEAFRKTVFEVSALTHRHPRSQWACFFYVEVLKKLLNGWDKAQAIDRARWVVGKFAVRLGATEEWKFFDRCRSTLVHLERSEIASSGYVVHTLEAALWCLLKGESYSETVLIAVNLGDDTDTTAAVTGALAGVVYGADAIPGEWLRTLAQRPLIEQLAGGLAMEKPLLIDRLVSLRVDGQIGTGQLRLMSQSIGQYKDLFELRLLVSDQEFRGTGSNAFDALQDLRRRLEIHKIFLGIEGVQRSVRLSGMLRESSRGMRCYRMEGVPWDGTPPVVETFADSTDPEWSSLSDQEEYRRQRDAEWEKEAARGTTNSVVKEYLSYFSRYPHQEPSPLLEAYYCLEQRAFEVQNIEHAEFRHQGELYRVDRAQYVFSWCAGRYQASVGRWPDKLEDRRFERAEDLVSDIVAWASEAETGYG